MSKILASKIKPIVHKYSDFLDEFEKLSSQANSLRIASGYISSDSIAHLKYYIENLNISYCELLVGMYKFEGITQKEYDALITFDEFLNSKKLGVVNIFTAFPYHGKLYLFGNSGSNFAAIMGSSNLSALENHRRFEIDATFESPEAIKEIGNLYQELKSKATKPISVWTPEIKEVTDLLGGCEGVKPVADKEKNQIWDKKINLKFSIPIKTEPKSNLNAFFGKGRLNTKSGVIRPRPWYEVEIIVPKEITEKKGYPVKGPSGDKIFKVYTDDGWEFDCKTSGDYSKNLRSANDLKTLGLWIKGRMENAGALKIGEPVTEDTLKKYGRDTIDLIATTISDTWILDFGVKK